MPFASEKWLQDCIGLAGLSGSETVLVLGMAPAFEIPEFLKYLTNGKLLVADGEWGVDFNFMDFLPLDRDRVVRIAAKSDEIDLDQAVDRVISVGVMGLYRDKTDVYAKLYRALTKGGLLVVDTAAPGNMDTVWEAASESIPGFASEDHHRYLSADDTTQLLESVGFSDVVVHTIEDPMQVADPNLFRAYVKRIFLDDATSQLPTERISAAQSSFFEMIPSQSIDFVRLRVTAKRPE